MFKTQPTEKHQKHQKSKNTSLQNKLFTGGTQREVKEKNLGIGGKREKLGKSKKT